MKVDKFVKSTGNGRHANHPKYTEQVKKQIDGISKNLSPSKVADAMRGVSKTCENAIKDNPDKKINEIKLP